MTISKSPFYGLLWGVSALAAGPLSEGLPIRVSVLDEAPFYQAGDGSHQGCDPAFYRRLADSGLRFELRPYPVNRLLALFERGEAQMMLVLSPDGEVPRQAGYEYLGPVLSTHYLLVGMTGALESDLSFVDGLRVGQPVSACWILCQQLKGYAIVSLGIHSIFHGLKLLEAGRLDLLVVPDLMFEQARLLGAWPPQHFVVRYQDTQVSSYYLALSTRLPETVRQQIRLQLAHLGAEPYRSVCLTSLSPTSPDPTQD